MKAAVEQFEREANVRTPKWPRSRRFQNQPVLTVLATAALSSLFLSSCGGGGGSTSTTPPASVEISISPTTASVMVDGTKQFTATVSNTTNTAVNWSVNNTSGGNSMLGTVSSTGLYTGPDLVPSSSSVTVTATSQADTTKSASATVSLAYPAPTLSSVSPTYVLVDSPETALTITGSGFTKASTVSFNNTSLSATYVSSTQLTATLLDADEGTEGQFNLAVVNPAPGGGTSSPALFGVVGGALTVNIIDLPSGTVGNVTVTGPNGLNVLLTATQTVTGAEGVYTVTAKSVAVGSSTYNAKAPAQSVTIASGKSATLSVDYYNVVPNTTKVLDQTALQSLSVSTDGLTLTMSASSPVAASLTAGDVVIVPPTSASGVAPVGMLRQVVSVSSDASQVVATTQKGTLAEAFQRASFQVQTQLTSSSLRAVHTRPGVTFRPGAVLHRAETGGRHLVPSDLLTDPCGGYSLGVFDIPESFPPPVVEPVSGLTLSGSVEVCSGLNFIVDITGIGFRSLGPTLNSLTATASMGAYSDLTLEGDFAGGSFDPDPITLGTLDLPPIDVPGLPVWVTPEVSVFVGADGNISTGLTTEVSAAGTYTGGATYASGTWSPVPLTPSFQFAYQPPTLSAALSAKAYAGVEFDLYVYDIVGPSFKPDGYLDLEASITPNPSWTLTAGLEGPLSVDVTFLGVTLASYDLGTMFDYSDVIASGTFSTGSSNPVPTITSLSPSSVTVGSTSQNLVINGTGFLASSTVSFNGIAHSPTFVSSTQLTISLTSSDLATAGSYPVVVTNPAPGGGPSNVVDFTVSSPAVTVTVGPSTVQLPPSGLQQFVATVTGLSNTAVNWAINGVPGGNSSVGTISEAGLYTAPATAPSLYTVTIAANSQADPEASGSASVAIGRYAESVLHAFMGAADGAEPTAPLIQASDGYFYGTAASGGPNAYGSTFKMDSSGNFTTLHLFSGPDGIIPLGALVQASDGYFYGITSEGGADAYGTMFKMDSSGNLTTLYSFTGGNDGGTSSAALIQASDSNLYGTTTAGGASGSGTVFRADTSGNITTLYSFSASGYFVGPSNLIEGADGYLYGTTSGGGANLQGEVFKMDLAGNLTVLYSFTGAADGGVPMAGLIQASDGLFYGTTSGGGANGLGEVFKIDSAGNLTVLYSFTGAADGENPNAGLIQAGDGDFYGTTDYGAAPACSMVSEAGTVTGCGAVFQMDPSGHLNSLYQFAGGSSDGSNPQAALLEGSDGFLYGTTLAGGAGSSCWKEIGNSGDCGVIFRLSGPAGPLPAQQATKKKHAAPR